MVIYDITFGYNLNIVDNKFICSFRCCCLFCNECFNKVPFVVVDKHKRISKLMYMHHIMTYFRFTSKGIENRKAIH